MPFFGRRSRENLAGCHTDLQRVFNKVVERFDCKVTCGRRGKEAQDDAFFGEPQRSKVQWPNSKHNAEPPDLSDAADVVPYPVDWKDLDRFYYFAGYVKAVAEEMGIELRWGGDWDGDTEVDDQTFFDLPHYEIVHKGKGA